MDIGVISSRYAKALLRFATERNDGERVYREMETLIEMFHRLPALNAALQSPVLAETEKLALLANASGGNVTTTTERFFALVLKKSRAEFMPFIAHAYLTLYRRQKHIVKGHLIVARPISDKQIATLRAIVEGRTGEHVDFDVHTDDNIGGGFILEYDTYRLDASVRGQIGQLRKTLGK